MIETALLLNAALVAALVTVLASSSALFGPRGRDEGAKTQPYETGMPPIAPAAASMSVGYHRFAVLFVVFDVDLALLVPWVLMRDRLALGPMIAISVFLAMIGLALAYVWRKGALEF